MIPIQLELLAQDTAERNILSDAERRATVERLEATLAWLSAAATFPWADPLDAAHEENRFERDTGLLGEEGAALWARFDVEMDRLFATCAE